VQVDVVSMRHARQLVHDRLDVIVKSGALADRAVVLDLKDHQRALVWVEGRFSHVLSPGLYAFWTALRDIKTEIVDARKVRFEHTNLPVILCSQTAERLLDSCQIEQGHVGVLFKDGEYVETLSPGRYAFWKDVAKVSVVRVDMRETIVDVSGQEIMTADKVTLRLNALVTYRVVDARQSLSVADDARQALYREAQLALRAVVGARDLDEFLTAKDAVAQEMEETLRERAMVLGLKIVSAGVRDVILPGDMKDLMNKVTEAKKAAEAKVISCREETAAMRSQANTAKLMEGSPTLMRLRELEVLERVATSGKLNIVLGEKGLADRVINLL
jgi:regulator of protease activity HflC (stomatin/prohibitin superfamily)